MRKVGFTSKLKPFTASLELEVSLLFKRTTCWRTSRALSLTWRGGPNVTVIEVVVVLDVVLVAKRMSI